MNALIFVLVICGKTYGCNSIAEYRSNAQCAAQAIRFNDDDQPGLFAFCIPANGRGRGGRDE